MNLDKLNLPELPAGYRWRVFKDWTLHEPKIGLDRRVWWSLTGWKKINDRWIFPDIHGGIEPAIEYAANCIWEDQKVKIAIEPYLGTTKP